MGWIMRLGNWRRRRSASPGHALIPSDDIVANWRVCRVEPLEPRLALAADIHVGAVYLEPGSEPSGIDQFGNTFTITWQGGVVGTKLTRIVIDTDVDGDGRITRGETFFDTAAGGPGAPGYGSFPFTVVEHAGFEITNFSVIDGGSRLVLDLSDFDAGELLVFRIDVDEATNSSSNAVAEGEEFADSILTATFEHVDYLTAVASDRFVDFFDDKLTKSGLPLPNDRYTAPPADPVSVYTAGAIAAVGQKPLPSSIAGRVHYDAGGDGQYGTGDQLLSGIYVKLLDAAGSVLATTTTNDQGEYRFDNLPPGTYSVREIQPLMYWQGGERVGSVGGVVQDTDLIGDILLGANVHAVRYDFWEVLPNSISGRVHVDQNGDCVYDTNEPLLAGVTIELLDSTGAVIDRTVTNDQGEYRFGQLPRGEYGIREIQPTGYEDAGEHVGTAGGELTANDLITRISLTSDTHGKHYDFCETVFVPPPPPPPERPNGGLSGYVFQDGPERTILTVIDKAQNYANTNDGVFTADDTPLAGVTLILADASGTPLLDAAGKQITTVTDATGYYSFRGLEPGEYSVIEVQPAGYIDGRDTAGPSGGLALHPGDIIRAIPVTANHESEFNNFSELRIREIPFFLPPNDPTPVKPPAVVVPEQPIVVSTPFVPVQSIVETAPNYGGISPETPVTWHLSVVNGGRPRADRPATINVSARHADVDWNDPQMKRATWRLRLQQGQATTVRTVVFGMTRGTPIVGDFNGDGTSDLAVFIDGEWFIDLNGNGVWDQGDLWAQLGRADDQPVAGDWDGDGKADIGIYGRAWPGDTQALQHEPGLPDPDNVQHALRKKNLPPQPHTAPLDPRTMQRTANGNLRADLIDHVFAYGQKGDQALVGDWNGSGVDTIGVFRAGEWQLDIDGDGRFGSGDAKFTYGKLGDRPVVGDFNGDGIDDIGVYCDGQWYLDMNGDRKLDDRDHLLQFGEAGDVPVVGDFDGDGKAEAGVFTPAVEKQADADVR